MTQQDRGAYTPQTDAPLAFDARAPRGARRPLPMALIGSGVVLLALVSAVVLYYRSGVRSPAAVPPTVGEPVATVKSAPAAGAKDEDPFSNLDVYASQNVPTVAPAKPAFVAPPEQPQARPAPGLKVQTVEPAPVHAAPAAVAAAHAAPTAPVAAAPLKPAAQAQTAAAAPAPAVAAAPVHAAVPATATPPDEAAPATPSSSGPASVQIGAYSSAALADKGYQQVATAFPTFMGGKGKRVEPLARDGKMLYRTSVSGFASRSSAQAFCAALKASGRVCLVKS